jgi:pyrroloquinoline quinone biosynthesis protein E
MTTLKPISMNIELTTTCPLRCPQCYCKLEGGKNIDPAKAIFWIAQASEMGVKNVCLSGGETLCYPYLNEVATAAAKHCKDAYVALSGHGFTSAVFEMLMNAGIAGIYISLNGSTEAINAKTRQGYHHAAAALAFLKEADYKETWLNWVMHNKNADDFENMIELAQSYGVRYLVAMAVKPDSHHQLNTMPTTEQMQKIAKIIKRHKGKDSNLEIMVESCFSPLLALVSHDAWFGNSNTGKFKGCGAGIYCFSVNVDGLLAPCRHLDHFEDWPKLSDYWHKSPILKKLRSAAYTKKQPCAGCKFGPYCRHCMAINDKLNGDIYLGHPLCGLHGL